ncbi:hypothetical protein SAMN05421639_10279 [Chryseobacterium shigense]|uniref:Uncharacterized protein n=1 Tax=Chryseobacterium shigense TaxID=297244 RepID=A0A1N7I510_9FLAO|nr:hypothetical protein SAMN05421639_10279 [Chryseobacterium shigense]
MWVENLSYKKHSPAGARGKTIKKAVFTNGETAFFYFFFLVDFDTDIDFC